MKNEKKKELIGKSAKIKIVKEGTKQILYTLRIIIFDPKKYFVGTDEAKEYWRKHDRISKARIKDEFGSIFATSTLVGRGKTKHFEFNKSTKKEADVIFIVPNKHKKEAFKKIQELEFYIK